MNVICIEEEAFYQLIEIVYKRLKDGKTRTNGNKWLSDSEAMQRLGIKSKTTLWKLRDTGCIKASRPSPRKYLFDADSIDEYLEKKTRYFLS